MTTTPPIIDTLEQATARWYVADADELEMFKLPDPGQMTDAEIKTVSVWLEAEGNRLIELALSNRTKRAANFSESAKAKAAIGEVIRYLKTGDGRVIWKLQRMALNEWEGCEVIDFIDDLRGEYLSKAEVDGILAGLEHIGKSALPTRRLM